MNWIFSLFTTLLIIIMAACTQPTDDKILGDWQAADEGDSNVITFLKDNTLSGGPEHFAKWRLSKRLFLVTLDTNDIEMGEFPLNFINDDVIELIADDTTFKLNRVK